jgi:hypothetical protein
MIKRAIFYIFSTIILIISLSCMNSNDTVLPALNPGSKANPDELTLNCLFPVQVGRNWTYRYRENKFSYHYNRIICDSSSLETWKVIENNGNPGNTQNYISVKRENQNDSSVINRMEYYLNNNNSSFLWYGFKDENKNEEHSFDGKLLVFPLEINSSWTTDIPFDGSDFYVKIKGINKISTVSDVVNSPAGTFIHCVRADFTAKERLNVTGAGLSDVEGIISYWYAPNIGIVETRLFIRVKSLDRPEIDEKSEITRILERYSID